MMMRLIADVVLQSAVHKSASCNSQQHTETGSSN